MRFAYQHRLYPTRAQIAFLEAQLREACDWYHAAIQERRDAWKPSPFRRRSNHWAQTEPKKMP